MEKMNWTVKRVLWFVAGMLSLGMAYIGLVTPGIPFSTFLTASAFCFAKSSKKWHDYLMNHHKFGPFLRNWAKYRIFPKYAKISMVIMMIISLTLTYLFTHNNVLVTWSAAACIGTIIWGFRYPSTRVEHDLRVAAGKKIAWIR